MHDLSVLNRAVTRHLGPFTTETSIPRLSLVGSDQVVEPFDYVYEPMVCFVSQGSKRTVSGSHAVVVAAGTMLVSAMEFPVTTTIESSPYRGVVLDLDEGLLSSLLLEIGPRGAASGASTVRSLSATPMSEALVDAVTRLVTLLDDPRDAAVLAPHVEAEILYRMLMGPAGATLSRLTVGQSQLGGVRSVAGWLREHLDRPIRIDDLASMANLSPASLHRHFKTTVGMSPLQYHKRLRLHEARRLLLLGEPAVAVAAAVGYGSAAQFTREYRRAYGLPPRQDAQRLAAAQPPERETKATA